MAYKIGTCNGHYEFVEMLRRFAKSNALVGAASFAGTGDGAMSGIGLTPAGSNEVWTVACIDTTTPGAELWSVTGSVSGAQAQYTTGGTYTENDIEFSITAGATAFVLGDSFTVRAAVFTGTGTGTIDDVDGQPAGVTETWTIACTDTTTPGAELWSVTGSVSGAQAAATTGVAYANDYLAFSISAGGTAFAVSDQFVVQTTQGALAAAGQAWVEERYIDNVLDAESLQDLELILRGPGLSGTEQIWAAITTNQSITSDYYNISLSTMVGYVPSNTLATQPSYSGLKWVPMWNLPIRYWLAVNGQRITFGCKVETHYLSGYVGKYFSYSTPGQFPYPICVAGTSATSTTRYSSSYTIDLFNSLSWRSFTGSWVTQNVLPYKSNGIGSETYFGNLAIEPPRDTGGDYPLLPMSLYGGTYGVVGDLDGVWFVPGFSSAVENIVQADGYDHVKIAEDQGTGFMDYFALRLD